MGTVGAMSSVLDDLDAAQHAAVTTPSRLVAVLAGAGTGKTRVLTRRIAWRLDHGDADARHTLALTFTREAAGELRRRLRRLGLRQQITSGTFHAVMLAMLRQRATDHGMPSPQIVASRHRLLREVGAGADAEAVALEADWCAARGVSPHGYEMAARLANRRPPRSFDTINRLLAAYDQAKRRRGVIDINDVLVEALALLERDPAFGDAVRWRFRHVHVDEAQDLNPIQHRLIHVLTAAADDLFLVGDPAQAIYGFNGADPSLLTHVGDHFPGVEIVRLADNHRCTPQVVAFGTHVLGTAGQPIEASSPRLDGPAVIALRSADERAEQATICDVLAGLDPSLLRASDVAVLSRTNAGVDRLRQAVATRGIPVRHRIDGPGTPVARVLDELFRLDSAAKLRAFAHDVLDAPAAVASPADHLAGPGPQRPHADGARVGAERLVAEAVLAYLREHPNGSGAGLQSWRNSTDPFGSRAASGVELLTFHGAKGREWHTVVLASVETGLVPHRSASTSAARAEEARLLYVAATRARERLIVSAAERRGGYARRPSPFVEGFVFGEHEPHPPPDRLRAAARRGAPPDDVGPRLLAWRTEAARVAALLPEQIVSDRQLAAIARRRPHTVDDLVAATGLGALTASRLLDGILAALDETEPAR